MTSLLRLALVALLVVAGLDLAVFRSGLYYRWAAPESTAGAVVHALNAAQVLYRPGVRNVLVVGDSRVGEGFSGAVANAAVAGSGLHFVPLSIAGSTPRVWSHVLPAFDLQRHPLAALVVTVGDLDDLHEVDDLPNRVLDLSYITPLANPHDLWAFAESASDPALAALARRNALLPGPPMRADALRWLAAPYQRIKDVRGYRAAWPYSLFSYGGHAERVTASVAEMRRRAPGDFSWSGYFDRLGGAPRRPADEVARYRSRWLGALSQQCQAAGIPMLLVAIPRGPFHIELGDDTPPGGSLAALLATGAVSLLPRGPYRALESPGNFFDALHLNSDGRRQFSRLLAGSVRDHLAGGH